MTPAPRQWTLLLPYQTPPLSLNDRMHYAVKARTVRNLIGQVRWLARAQKIPRLERIHVQLHYRPARAGVRDEDNLVATLKPCIDGLRDHPARYKDTRMVRPPWTGIVADDDPEHVRWAPPQIHPNDRDHVGPRLWLVITEGDTAP